MRTSKQRSTPALPPPPPQPIGIAAIQVGVHGLRLVGGVLLDFPLPAPAGARCWVATIWPDHRSASGWGGLVWQPDLEQGRGWRWPARAAVGDVVEFATDEIVSRRKLASLRWWGVIDDYDGSWLLSVHGPFPSLDDAQAFSAQLIQTLQSTDRELRELVVAPAPASVRHRGRVRTHAGR